LPPAYLSLRQIERELDPAGLEGLLHATLGMVLAPLAGAKPSVVPEFTPSPRASGRDGVQLPLAWNSLELMGATVVEGNT
jgi:hypothetical protein